MVSFLRFPNPSTLYPHRMASFFESLAKFLTTHPNAHRDTYSYSLKKMKYIEDLLCASPASTAICSSMDQILVRRCTRPIDRHMHHHRLGETPRSRTNAPAPCSSQLPIVPSRPRPSYYKSRKSCSAANVEQTASLQRRKSSAGVDDLAPSPLSSSRYLLSDKPHFLDVVSSSDSSQRAVRSTRFPAFRALSTSSYESPAYEPPSLTGPTEEKIVSSVRLSDHLNLPTKSSLAPSNFQVVELRVSIHCKCCEGKLRKYISRMEGVASFSIDLATKKVTVIGDVTPLGVLTSISKVKNAQFWTSPTSSSTPRVGFAR